MNGARSLSPMNILVASKCQWITNLFVRFVDDVDTVDFNDSIRSFEAGSAGWRVQVHFANKMTFCCRKAQTKGQSLINGQLREISSGQKDGPNENRLSNETHRHASYQPANEIRSLHPAAIWWCDIAEAPEPNWLSANQFESRIIIQKQTKTKHANYFLISFSLNLF